MKIKGTFFLKKKYFNTIEIYSVQVHRYYEYTEKKKNCENEN